MVLLVAPAATHGSIKPLIPPRQMLSMAHLLRAALGERLVLGAVAARLQVAWAGLETAAALVTPSCLAAVLQPHQKRMDLMAAAGITVPAVLAAAVASLEMALQPQVAAQTVLAVRVV
jgi:hypothetical protein